ncbi:MAG TPA: hypothetical protein VGG82_07700 [Casimicrobiaceae bacterium]|jgi:hypothetical protein
MATTPALQLVPESFDDPVVAGILRDYELTETDKQIIAESLVEGKKHSKSLVKSHGLHSTDLARAITTVAIDLQSAGAPSLVITMLDPTWRLLDSGFFDVDADGKLDNIDINYPDRSRFWWRLHQFSPQDDKSIQITLLPWAVVELMNMYGPIKVNRASRTRAEFFKLLVEKIPVMPGRPKPTFYCKQLDIKQPVGSGTSTANQTSKSSSKSKQGQAAKSVGIGTNAHDLTCRGQGLSSSQQAVVNTILQVGDSLHAPTNALIAAIYAAMGETNLSFNNTFQYTGVAAKSTAEEAHEFFMGTGPFGNGGAIHLANAGHPPAQIANACEVNAVYIQSGGSSANPNAPGDSYARQSDPPKVNEAAAIVQAGGGGSAGGSLTIETTQPYYFQINAGEDYWTGMNRLAQEVVWDLIADGERFYYDAELTLIRQKVATVLHRDDPSVISWHYDWENRHVITEMTCSVICEPFAFSAGEVWQMDGFGPGTVGSTAKPPLPGRWLITEIQRTKGDAFSVFTLKQPVPPKKEPAPQVTQTSASVKGGNISAALGSLPPRSVEACYKAAQLMDAMKIPYSQGSRTLVAHPPSADCSSSTSWMLWMAGFTLPGGINKAGQWPPVSGAYESWGDPGKGKTMTIWCNADHVFTEFYVPGLGHMQFNTSGGGNGPRLFAWGANGQADAASGSFTARHPPGL